MVSGPRARRSNRFAQSISPVMRLLTSLFAPLLMAACTTGPLDQTGTFLPPEHEKQLAAQKVCCASYREFHFQKLNKDAETAFTLVPDSPVFQFPHGRSYFVAYELPVAAATLVVKTVPVNMLYNPVGHVLVPAVVFLDGNKNLIGITRPSYTPKNPRFIGDSWAEASLPIVQGARFAVLVDAKNRQSLAWRDSDQRSGYLVVRSGPTGLGSVVAFGGSE